MMSEPTLTNVMNSLTQINNILCNVEKRLRRLEVLDKKVKGPEEKMKKLK